MLLSLYFVVVLQQLEKHYASSFFVIKMNAEELQAKESERQGLVNEVNDNFTPKNVMIVL